MSFPISQLKKRIDAAADYFGFPKVQFELLAEAPLVFLVSEPSQSYSPGLASCLTFLAGKALRRDVNDPSLLFRGVGVDRLQAVIRTGCDVSPSDAPLYAACLEKALEYGGYSKVVQVFDPQKLERTFTKVRKTEAPEELNLLRVIYPSCKELDDGWLWFSKLPPGDFRIGTAYEMEYSFFIPGNPLDALLLVFLLGNEPGTLRATWRELHGEPGRPDPVALEQVTK